MTCRELKEQAIGMAIAFHSGPFVVWVVLPLTDEYEVAVIELMTPAPNDTAPAPLAPVAPVGPVAPVAPVGPVAPVTPVGPVA
ncbi:MAG: hypothetical protein PHR16_08590, partial [Methylovulum sp.]|nr:hypothetical protein [Methylovulum sp.]